MGWHLSKKRELNIQKAMRRIDRYLGVCAPSEPGPSKCYDGYKEDNCYDGCDDVHLRPCLPGEVAVGGVEN